MAPKSQMLIKNRKREYPVLEEYDGEIQAPNL